MLGIYIHLGNTIPGSLYIVYIITFILLSSSTRRRFYAQRSSGQAVVTGICDGKLRQLLRSITFLALCLFERQRRAATQRPTWRGADTRHATRTLLLERYATAASKYNWDAVAWFRAVCLARSCECDTVVLIVPDIRNIYRVIYMDNVDTI